MALLQNKAEKQTVVDAYLHTILLNSDTSAVVGGDQMTTPGELAVGAILKDMELEGRLGHNNAQRLGAGGADSKKPLNIPQKSGGATLRLSPAKKVTIPKKESPKKAPTPVKEEKKLAPAGKQQQKIGFAIQRKKSAEPQDE